MANPLLRLLLVRGLAKTKAQNFLSLCLIAETTTERQISQIEDEIEHEIALAADTCDNDATVEDYSAWFRKARQKLTAAHAAQQSASADTVRARAILAAARAAVETVEKCLEDFQAEQAAQILHREQQEIDQMTQGRHVPNR